MLEQLFNSAPAIERLRCAPLGSYLDDYAASLLDLGYCKSSVRARLGLVAEFGRWLERKKVPLADFDEQAIGRFADERQRRGHLRRGQRHSIQGFLEHLRFQGRVRAAHVEVEASPLSALEHRYEAYLREERGLTTATVVNYLPFARRFLIERFRDAPLRVRDLEPKDISRFILRHAHSMSPGRAKLMVSVFRSFFGFLLYQGEIETDLSASVPTVPDWRLTTVPKYLCREEVERTVDACDRNTPTGRRDYAILLLLARLGLRAGEVVALELDDIDWRGGQITVPGKGLRRDRLPLLADVGKALVDYLRKDRPPCPMRRVFLRMKAPWRGFVSPAAVSTLVRRALERAGLEPPMRGAHLLRHSLATGMLRGGASMREVGEVLRHRNLATTEIYAKVDFAGLRALAQPWPVNRGGR